MISAKTLIHQPLASQRRYLEKDAREGALCYQLSATNPNELALATKIVTDHGADYIDLNCGCPKKKIRKKGAGSAHLENPKQLYTLIRAMKENTTKPVSIKIRVEGQSDSVFNQEIATVVQDAGADQLIVHGRHWNEHYETPCNYDEIRYFVSALTIPVIGNGDIACLATLKKMLATNCKAVMISRAGVGQPWLMAQLEAELHHKLYQPPGLTEIGELFLEHVQGLIDLLNNEKIAILQARKLAKYYARTVAERSMFCDKVNAVESFRDLVKTVHAFFN